MPQAVTARADVTSLMAEGGFPMRKWFSSSPEVLATVPEAERSISNETLEQGGLPFGRALGIRWDVQSDTLGLAYAHIERPPTQWTKHSILAKLAGLYDPLTTGMVKSVYSACKNNLATNMVQRTGLGYTFASRHCSRMEKVGIRDGCLKVFCGATIHLQSVIKKH